MKIAMLSGLYNSDPQVKKQWQKIPYKGEVPTPEELITYLAEHIKAGTDLFL